MRKISTVFKKDPNDLGRVINEVNPENAWVFTEKVLIAQKFDGTACMIKDGEIYKRYDAKKGKSAPAGAIPCQEPDPVTGHHPHWVKCDRSDPADKYHFEAFDAWIGTRKDGTYELCGPKVNGNAEILKIHLLFPHDPYLENQNIYPYPLSFESIKEYLRDRPIEGLVFYHPDGRMAKIRRKDFAFKWPVR